MDTTIQHILGRSVSLYERGVELFRYLYDGREPVAESPRPIFHPMRTRRGNIVTAYRPWDHSWHKGLSMTSASLSGHNFWGGPTYVRDKGYVMRENHGRQVHVAWVEMQTPCRLAERVDWVTIGGATILEELRRIELLEIEGECWSMKLSFSLRNVATESLEFGSPTTNGRPSAGYGGLFWRAPRSFYAGNVIALEGDVGDSIMGKRSPFLAYVGRHDETGAHSTIIFVDSPTNPRHPTQWFVRNGPDPFLSASFMFDEVLELPAGETLELAYALCVADGELAHSAVLRRAEALAEMIRSDSE